MEGPFRVKEMVKDIIDHGLVYKDERLYFGSVVLSFSSDDPNPHRTYCFKEWSVNSMSEGERIIWVSFDDQFLTQKAILFYRRVDMSIGYHAVYTFDEDEFQVIEHILNNDYHEPEMLEKWKQMVLRWEENIFE